MTEALELPPEPQAHCLLCAGLDRMLDEEVTAHLDALWSLPVVEPGQ